LSVLDLSSTDFNRSLCETIAWCSSQALTSRALESADIRHRRELFEESGAVMRHAYERVDRSWFRHKVSNTKEWRRGMALLKEADPDSLPQLKHQLRSPLLKTNLPS
jgi:hypothetical protein